MQRKIHFIRRVAYSVIGLIVLLLLFIVYLGAFQTVSFVKEDIGPYTLIFNRNKGNYDQTGTIIEEVGKQIKQKYNIECLVGFGIFYDNPKQVKVEDLRSDTGCIIQEDDLNKIKDNIDINNFKRRKFLVAKFPYKNKFSILVGMIKVYPLVQDKIENDNFKIEFMMEIYDKKNDVILYLIPA